jgi:hypothetical protein
MVFATDIHLHLSNICGQGWSLPEWRHKRTSLMTGSENTLAYNIAALIISVRSLMVRSLAGSWNPDSDINKISLSRNEAGATEIMASSVTVTAIDSGSRG